MVFSVEPQTFDQFVDLCFRRLGKPVHDVTVTREQAEERVREALRLFRDFHHAGLKRHYMARQFTAEDVENKYITLPSEVHEVVRVLPATGSSSGALFTPINYAKFSFMHNYFFGPAAFQINGFSIAMSHLEMLDEQLGNKVAFTFNRYDDKLYIQTDWTFFKTNDYIVLEVYTTFESTEIWNDPWLIEYCTALIEQQWGTNLTKFDGFAILNGVKINGEKIYERSTLKLSKLKAELRNLYCPPPLGFMA